MSPSSLAGRIGPDTNWPPARIAGGDSPDMAVGANTASVSSTGPPIPDPTAPGSSHSLDLVLSMDGKRQWQIRAILDGQLRISAGSLGISAARRVVLMLELLSRATGQTVTVQWPIDSRPGGSTGPK